MAFDIGERVKSRFMGEGVIIGEIFKLDDGDGGIEAMQRVKFDNAMFGERDYAIKKLIPVEDGGDIGA